MRRIDVGVRPTNRRELAAWYSTVLDAQAASGLSVADYAKRVGVAFPTLYQWRRRLESPSCGDRGRHRVKLVEVTVTRRPPSATDGIVVRVCEGRRSIDVPRGFDGDELRRLVTVLESC